MKSIAESFFSPQQIAVLEALVHGSSVTQAADAAGIHRNTIANWRRESVPFRVALANAQYDRALLFREKAEELTDQAFDTLRVIMSDEKASPSVRLRAALAVVKLVTAQVPPQKKVDITFADTMVDPYVEAAIKQRTFQLKLKKSAQNAQSGPAPAPASASTNTIQTVRRDHPKVGRNDACPCGSGLKHKRCCLNKPQPAPAAAAA